MSSLAKELYKKCKDSVFPVYCCMLLPKLEQQISEQISCGIRGWNRSIPEKQAFRPFSFSAKYLCKKERLLAASSIRVRWSRTLSPFRDYPKCVREQRTRWGLAVTAVSVRERTALGQCVEGKAL